MRDFLETAMRFRETPIVDDDFPVMRDKFDNEMEYLYDTMPKIVCLCGSTKFGEAFRKANLRETLLGNIVLSVGSMTQSDTELMASGRITDEVKIELDELHKRKIDLCDEILVLDVDGYIGESTRSEIDYARMMNKIVRYLSGESVTEIVNDMLGDNPPFAIATPAKKRRQKASSIRMFNIEDARGGVGRI